MIVIRCVDKAGRSGWYARTNNRDCVTVNPKRAFQFLTFVGAEREARALRKNPLFAGVRMGAEEVEPVARSITTVMGQLNPRR